MKLPRIRNDFYSPYLHMLQKSGLWRSMPHLTAFYLSGGAWQAYPWLQYVSEFITPKILRGNARIIIDVPPRHGKSEFLSHWLPVWFLNRFPYKKVMMTGASGPFAVKYGKKVRDTIQDNQDFLNVHIPRGSEASADWGTTEGGEMTSRGFGGQITGSGGHLILIDDPHKDWKEAQSPTIREGVIQWFNGTLYSRQEPGCSIIVIQTRWHEEDLAGYLMDTHPEHWDVIRLEALYTGKEPDPMGRKIGEPLCDDRYSVERLNIIKKAVGSVIWAATYQQNPIPAGGATFKKDWFQIYTELPQDPYGAFYASWDTAFEDTEGSAYSVGTVWYVCSKGYFLVEVVRKRMLFPELKRTIKQLSERYDVEWNLIEYKASGKSAIQDLREEAEIPVIPIKVSNDEGKLVRAMMCAGLVETGIVHLPSSAPWLAEYLNEVLKFPNSKTQDQVDSTTQFLNWIKKRFNPKNESGGVEIF